MLRVTRAARRNLPFQQCIRNEIRRDGQISTKPPRLLPSPLLSSPGLMCRCWPDQFSLPAAGVGMLNKNVAMALGALTGLVGLIAMIRSHKHHDGSNEHPDPERENVDVDDIEEQMKSRVIAATIPSQASHGNTPV
jgi:hypothetical protein